MAASLDELFVRYWDSTLPPEQVDELSARLAADPEAAARFREFCLQAVVLAEPTPRPAAKPRRWAVAAVAAGLLVAVGGLLWSGRPEPVRLARVTGLVRLGQEAVATAGGAVPAGQTVTTVGLGATAVLAYPDGSEVVLTGDTEARVGGRRLDLIRGAVLADAPAGGLVLATAEASASPAAGAKLVVSRAVAQTEVGVSEGRVQVADADGDTVADMGGGEVVTVNPAGTAHRATGHAPDSYAWPTAGPLFPGWEMGRLSDGLAGRAVLPTLRFDRHNNRDCWMIRSDNRWVRGLFAVHADTVARVRYKVDRPGVGQLLAVIRPDDLARNGCNVLVAPVPFEPAADGGWREETIPLSRWAIEPMAGRFPPGPLPWTAFLVIFNTYEHDLGLQVAEFSVSRGPGP